MSHGFVAQVQPYVQKLRIAQHCADVSKKREVTEVRPGLKALKGGSFAPCST